jgi:hypothetical protein
MGKMKNANEVFEKKRGGRGRKHLLDFGTDGRKILKWILKKQDVRM